MIAGTLAAGAHPGSYNGNDAQRGNLIADTLTAPGTDGGRRDKMVISFDWQTAGSERTSIIDQPGATRGLSSSKTLAVAFAQNARDEVRQIGGDGSITGALSAETGTHQTTYVAYNIQQNDGGQHRRPDRPEGGMYVKETDTALTVGSTDQTVVAKSLGAHHGRLDLDPDTYITIPDVAYALADATGSRTGTGRDAQDTFIFEPRYARNGRGAPDTIAPPLKAQNGGTGKGDGAPAVAQPPRAGRQYSDMGDGQAKVVVAAMHETGHLPGGVRRLTPTECERLQGFPDGHTAGQSDSARYRQLGNAVPVPVARWIGARIMAIESQGAT